LSIYKRKNLDNFLNYLKEECEPVLWTTAVPEYTEVIMRLIDPERKIKHVFTQ
jgi:TFIIF-interacting CTD phosphatase-like protein